ncbi:MAG: hypothetical protein H3C34_25370, partial [Caldilineaceae bacterium]|nr:hypothetical protein [Caldilineaceae bacterium]
MARLVLAFLWIGTMVAPVAAAPAQLPALYPTPGPGCFEVIANGSFEQTGVAWVPGSGPRPPEYSSTEVLEGAQAMRLGIVDLPNVSSDSYVSQDVTLPAGATLIILRFWYWPQYDAAPGPTALQYANIINLFNGQFVAQPLGVQRNDRIWLPMQYDLTAQAGQQIRLTLGVRNDGAGGRAAMYVDNVSIIVCTVTPTPSVTATTTGTPPPTPTLTATPIPTLPTGCTTDTILNGDFEIDAFWFFGDDPVPAGYVGSTPHTGLRSMRLGIAPELGVAVQNKESFSSINQPFTISPFASTARLRWWHFYRSEEPPLAGPTILQDRQEVVLLAPDNETVAILHRTRQNEVAWKEEVIDLTPYRGRPLLLYFNAYNDGNGLRTWQYLDDV